MTTTALFASVALATCSLPAGDIKDPQTWGDYFLDKYAAERAAALENIEPGPAPLPQPRTVLLITGVTIPAEWFDPIVARLQRDGFNPVVWEPPALLSGDLFENSHRLADVVDQIRAETGEEKIDILAECTGGLLARHYIQSLGGDQYIDRMVTFISPQHGVPKAKLAASLVSWPALYDLTPGSEFLTTVNSAPLPDNVAFTSIYTCTDEYIQPYTTSIIPGAKNIGLCDKFVGHYQFFYDPEIYKIMHAELVAPLAANDGDDKGDDGTMSTDTTDAGGCSTTGGGDVGALLVLGALVALRRRK
ncbi:MAG TPA: MYXO-CTERM sorting domain-containing protein [Kofleriaceae bacterium]